MIIFATAFADESWEVFIVADVFPNLTPQPIEGSSNKKGNEKFLKTSSTIFSS